jgi:hypothetical protein
MYAVTAESIRRCCRELRLSAGLCALAPAASKLEIAKLVINLLLIV